jgi:hypothetical protein
MLGAQRQYWYDANSTISPSTYPITYLVVGGGGAGGGNDILPYSDPGCGGGGGAVPVGLLVPNAVTAPAVPIAAARAAIAISAADIIYAS